MNACQGEQNDDDQPRSKRHQKAWTRSPNSTRWIRPSKPPTQGHVRDSLDTTNTGDGFFETSVWGIREPVESVFEAAYHQGLHTGYRQGRSHDCKEANRHANQSGHSHHPGVTGCPPQLERK